MVPCSHGVQNPTDIKLWWQFIKQVLNICFLHILKFYIKPIHSLLYEGNKDKELIHTCPHADMFFKEKYFHTIVVWAHIYRAPALFLSLKPFILPCSIFSFLFQSIYIMLYIMFSIYFLNVFPLVTFLFQDNWTFKTLITVSVWELLQYLHMASSTFCL